MDALFPGAGHPDSLHSQLYVASVETTFSLQRHVVVRRPRVDQHDSFVCTCSATHQEMTLPFCHYKGYMICILAGPDIVLIDGLFPSLARALSQSRIVANLPSKSTSEAKASEAGKRAFEAVLETGKIAPEHRFTVSIG